MSPLINTIDEMKEKIKKLDALAIWLESKAHDEKTWSYRRIYLEVLTKIKGNEDD